MTGLPSVSNSNCPGAPASVVGLGRSGSSFLGTEPFGTALKGRKGGGENRPYHPADVYLQRTGVVKSAVLWGWTPYHLKSAQGRSRHHLKWPFSFLLFMGLVGYLHPITPFLWPHLRLYFWHLIGLREEKRREKSILKDNLAVVLAVHSVDWVGINNAPPGPPFVGFW